MSLKSKKDIWQLALLVIIVLISRLPFLSSGYGIDGDSWSVAIHAKQLHDTGKYEASRLPGFPVHEYLASMFIKYGAFGLNLISAVFSAIAVLFFALILKLLRFRYTLLASITFSSVPVFYIHSTTTIDYVIAIAFILSSMYFLLRGKLIVAGILLGFAVGTRITSGAMLIPFAILLIDKDGFSSILNRLIRIGTATLLTSCILFIPVIKQYGLNFLDYYNVPYPSISKVLYKLSFEVWGVIGFFGIIISTGLLFLPDRITAKKFMFPRSVNEKFVISWLVAIDLYIIAFLKLPMESGYLIPIVPFVIFIFGKYLYNKAFVFFCVMLIASSFALTISPVERFDAASPSKATISFITSGEKLNLDFLKGPVESFESRRRNGMHFVEELIKSTDTIKTRSVLVAGRWFNQMVVQSVDTGKLNIKLRSYLSEEEAVYFYAKGYVIYYMPKQDIYNKAMRNVDLEIYKAIPYMKE